MAGTRPLPGAHRVLGRAPRVLGPATPRRGEPRRTAVAGPPIPRPARPSRLFGRRGASASLQRPAGREAGAPARRQLGVVPRPDGSPPLSAPDGEQEPVPLGSPHSRPRRVAWVVAVNLRWVGRGGLQVAQAAVPSWSPRRDSATPWPAPSRRSRPSHRPGQAPVWPRKTRRSHRRVAHRRERIAGLASTRITGSCSCPNSVRRHSSVSPLADH